MHYFLHTAAALSMREDSSRRQKVILAVLGLGFQGRCAARAPAHLEGT